jgi:cytochrome c-type biogenesis protein CcmH/NrfG
LLRKQPAAAAEALTKARKLDAKNATFAADLCKAEVDRDPVGPEGPKQCRAALGLEPDNALARYMLGKTLVARGECAAAKAEIGRFLSLASVKAEAKSGAEALLATCKPGAKQAPPK